MTDTQTEPDIAPRAPIEFRRAGDFEVRFADRIIELVAVPYDFEAATEYPPNSGRTVIETIDPGSFAGVERRANRVKVNRDHDVTRTCGRAIALHPSRTEGLIAEIRIARTPLGDETLELADDHCLEPSVGMAVAPSWHVLTENRSRRRITKAFLDHIAMLPEGAYGGLFEASGDGAARVLSVRQKIDPPAVPVPTPNIDEITAWLYQQKHT